MQITNQSVMNNKINKQTTWILTETILENYYETLRSFSN